MSLNKPLISFVLPTYNRAHYIAMSIESVREQTEKNWELIVVDDGSTDTTLQLMEYYTKLDHRIRYVKNDKNEGIGYSRNKGNLLAKAPVIAVHDSDDLSHPDRAKITLQYLKKHPKVDYFYGSYLVTDIFGEPIREEKAESQTLKSIMVKQTIPHFVSAYRAKVAIKYPYNNDHKVNDDYPFIVNLMKAGKIFGFTSKVLGKLRQLGDGVSMTRAEEVNKITKEIAPDYEVARAK